MSRGLGRNQSAVLLAMRQLEESRGETGGFRVWIVLEQIWNSTLRAQREAEAEERRANDAAHRAELEAAIAAGNADAVIGLRNLDLIDMLAGIIRGSDRRSSTRVRSTEAHFEDLNPSRTFALLAKRNLITRHMLALATVLGSRSRIRGARLQRVWPKEELVLQLQI